MTTSTKATQLDSGHLGGAIVVNVIALISTLALILVALRTIWQAIRFCLGFKLGSDQPTPRETFFFRTRMGAYAACMLAGNLFSSVAGVIGLSWIAQRQISPGTMCTAQAIFMSVGNISGAYFTVALGVHTFNSLVLQYRQSGWLGVVIIGCGWVLALVLAVIPLSPTLASRSSAMYGPGEVSCGIQSIYPQILFYHHLLPIFLAAVFSAVLYSLIFLSLRGYINFGGVRINISPRWNGAMRSLEDYHQFVVVIARSMLWFPVAFIVFLMPYSLTRLLMLSGFRVSSAAVMFAFACWYLLGMVNVLILFNTFRLLTPGTYHRSMASSATGVSLYATDLGPRGDIERQDASLAQTPAVHHDIASTQNSMDSPVSDRGRVAPEERTSDRIYVPRNISPESELNDKLDLDLATPAMARDRSPLRLGPPDTPGLTSAPRPTRSPIIRHPTNEGIPYRAGAMAMPLNKYTKPTFEPEIFGVSPLSTRSPDYALDGQELPDSPTIHIRHPSPDDRPGRRSAVPSWISLPASPDGGYPASAMPHTPLRSTTSSDA